LIVDGHRSRENFDAVFILQLFNVELLILPPHHSHILQPFDLTIGSPLKIAFGRDIILTEFPPLEALVRDIQQKEQKITRKELRERFIEIFLNAVNQSCTYSNIVKGFEAAGIVPLNRDRAMGNKYLMDGDRVLPDGVRVINLINSKLLTDPAEARMLYENELGKRQIAGATVTLGSIFNKIKSNTVKSGKPLSKFPDLIDDRGGVYLSRYAFPF
jgi:hypothetical protein